MYFLASIFWVYNIYKLMMLFFDKEGVNKTRECLCYGTYFILNIITYLVINIPIVIVVCNLINFVVISLNYKASWKKRVLAIGFIFLIPLCIEMLIVQFMLQFQIDLFTRGQHEFNYIFCVIQIAIYAAVLILGKCKNIKKGDKVPGAYWIFIVIILFISLYIIFLFLYVKAIPVLYVNLAVIGILMINFLTFYLYDRTSITHIERTEKLLLEQQNKYYNEQFEIMNTSIQATRAIKHDLNNHLASIYSLIQQENIEGALEHLRRIKDSYSEQGKYIQSGNLPIDSVLNFKLQEAYQQNVEINLDVSIPEKLQVPSFDIVTILGNLLDNALYAIYKLEQNRIIDIKMRYDKGCLVFKISNAYNGELIKKGSSILTTKKDRVNHGIGLKNVKKVVEKYQGMMDIEHSDKIFSVSLLLYVD